VKILNKAGIEVAFPDAQTCCGAPARYSGAYEVAGQNAIDNIKALLEEKADYVVSACPTCTVALKHESSILLKVSPDSMDGLRQGSCQQGLDFSFFVKKLCGMKVVGLQRRPAARKFTYHDSCHLKRTLMYTGTAGAPAETGYDLVEMFESDTAVVWRLILAQVTADFCPDL